MLFDDDFDYGVYDADGFRVVEAAYRRGPGPSFIGSSEKSIHNPADFAWAPDDEYIYCGIAFFHYGHFLLSTFSRYWSNNSAVHGAKCLFHFDAPTVHWQELSFVEQLNAASGINRSSVISLQEPVRIRRLIVPAPAFEETLHSFVKYRQMALQIRGQLPTSETLSKTVKPVYFSKRALGNGVRKFLHEEVIEDVFEHAGFEIVFPEQIPISDQISLFEQRPIIVGMVGSALHTSIFARNVCPILALNNTGELQSNFTLIDKLTDADATYVYPAEGILGAEDGSSFSAKFLLYDTRATALELLDLAKRKLDGGK